jgi:agmatinase
LITLGGDHTITLPILRSIHSAYGPVSVIHFDSHLDTWAPFVDGDTNDRNLNHATYLYFASEEGLLKKGESIHAGIGSPLTSIDD